jgi:hypothetical protein
MKGSRYYVYGVLVIRPEKLKNMNDQEIKNEIDNAKDEMLGLVKSILEKE